MISAILFLIAAVTSADVVMQSTAFGNAPVKHFYFRNSDVILLHESSTDKLWRSEDQGLSWDSAAIDSGTKVLIEHPFDSSRAYVLMNDKRLFKTEDQGVKWSKVSLPAVYSSFSKAALAFNAQRSSSLLYMAKDEVYYTENNGQNWNKLPVDRVQSCQWGLATDQFQYLPQQAIFCLQGTQEGYSDSAHTQIAYSEDYFKTSKLVQFDKFQTSGVVGMGAVKKFWVVAVKSPKQDLDMYISTDGLKFYNAVFPLGVGIKEDSYTVLDSSSTSLMVDISTSKDYGKEVGTLYRSDSTGRYFVLSLDNTNKNSASIVDYERVQGVEGVVLANIVSNPTVLNGQYPEAKKVESRISFNDGSSWMLLTPPKQDVEGKEFKCISEVSQLPHEKCALHLHSMTDPHNPGYIFSDAGVPGVIIGIGNVGDYLAQYDQSDSFLSTDGGLTWKQIRKGPHRYESADQGGILAIVDDKQSTDLALFSLDFGKSWQEVKLPTRVRARTLTSDPASTSQKMILLGGGDNGKFQVTSLDFSKQQTRQCGNNDFEMWRARSLNEDAECLMGHYQDIQRRKQEVQCYVGRDYKTPEQKITNCQCSAENFECDSGYIADKHRPGKCIASGEFDVIKVPQGSCVGDAATYEASSGYRKIPGDTCVGGVDLAKTVQRPCKNVDRSASIISQSQVIDAMVTEKYLFDDSEIVLLKFSDGSLRRSDHTRLSIDKVSLNGQVTGPNFKVMKVYMHDGDSSRVYVFTSTDKLFWSNDKGQSFIEIVLPSNPSGIGSDWLDFHPTEKDWLLFVGSTKCPDCHSSAFVSKDNGNSWSSAIDTYVSKCLFSQDKDFKKVDKDSIFCTAYANKFGAQDGWNNAPFTLQGNRLMLYTYKQFGNGEKKQLAERVVQYYVYEQFLAIAVEADSKVKLMISTDGVNLVETQFPSNVAMEKNAFTIVQSNTGTIFLDVFQDMNFNQEYGYLFDSNSNGTYYTLSLKNTNRNSMGLVDFEQIQSIDGMLIANVVQNADRVRLGEAKQITTKVSYDAGGHWNILADVFDIEHKKIACADNQNTCQLHLHGRSEITWTGPIFSGKSATGILMGVGNVGPYLVDYTESDTFLTRDGGLTWTMVRKGPHIFEFGDSGGLLVLVSDGKTTNELVYSLDDGLTWSTYAFYGKDIRVTSLFTETSAKSSKFIITGNEVDNDGSHSNVLRSIGQFLRSVFTRTVNSVKQVVVHVDLSKAAPQTCVFKEDGTGDFEKWNPSQSDCILGQEMTYWVRKANHQCHIGNTKPQDVSIKRQCQCSDIDYECDSGFFRQDGKCVLQGYDVLEPVGCVKDSKYQGRSGYRKIAASKCTGQVDSLEAKVERTCSGNNAGGVVIIPPSEGKAGIETQTFDQEIDTITWFAKTNNAILRDNTGNVWSTDSAGSSWKNSNVKEHISVVTPNPYVNDRVYLIQSTSMYHFVSTDGGKQFSLFKTPAIPNTFKAPVLEFHAEEPDWIIFVGNVECPSQNCRTQSWYTKDNGLTWTDLEWYVVDCEWARDAMFKQVDKQTIFCSQYAQQSGNMLLKSAQAASISLFKSHDFFRTKELIFQNLVGFAVSENFMVVAVIPDYDPSHLNFFMSLNGAQFAQAVFPPSVDNNNRGFTVLESASGSIFLDMFKHSGYGSEWGTLFVSNQNGTYYSVSLEGTNRSPDGFVDYERILGVEGAATMNQVVNRQGVSLGEKKQCITKITYNEGSSWSLLKHPAVDFDGMSYSCAGQDDCSLHLHGFTEKKKIKNEMSDEGAVGVMIGVGNVGKSLISYEQANTYLTRDAGLTWKEILKGPHYFEFGDFGSVIVAVHTTDPVNFIWYSITEGATFQKFEFHSTQQIYADRFVTDPSGTSQIFMLVGRPVNGKGSVVVKLDFSKMRSKKCVLDKNNLENSDFEPWSLTDTKGNQCVFGHECQYYRRKTGRNCWIGSDFKNERTIVKHCECTEADFECDANFYRDPQDGKCKAFIGEGKDVWSDCVNGQQYLSNGYRKRSKSTCTGGIDMAKHDRTAACNWGVGSGSSAGAWAAGILIPLSLLGAGFLCYRRRQLPFRRGSIQLPLSSTELPRRDYFSFGKVLDMFRRLINGIYADMRARSGYRTVPLQEGDVHMDIYE